MNSPDMLDYALGRLEAPALVDAEREIAADPALAERLDRLQKALHRLLDDSEAIKAPDGLAERTVARVDALRPRRRGWRDYVPVSVPFRWADLAVAAGIVIASLLTLLPAVHRSKQRMDQAACGFNLQQLGVSLAQYAHLHGAYPYAPREQPHAATGTFAAMLHDGGFLADPTMLDCPCNGPSEAHEPMPSFADLAALEREAPERYHRLVGSDYAYHAGYRRPSGATGPVPAGLSMVVPLMADQPPHSQSRVLQGNSPNHGAHGQNVLYSDGHVHWHNSRRVGPRDPDMYLNADHKPEPGVGPQDAVLLPGEFPFSR